jgi:hypothetical protein
MIVELLNAYNQRIAIDTTLLKFIRESRAQDNTGLFRDTLVLLVGRDEVSFFPKDTDAAYKALVSAMMSKTKKEPKAEARPQSANPLIEEGIVLSDVVDFIVENENKLNPKYRELTLGIADLVKRGMDISSKQLNVLVKNYKHAKRR